MIQIVKADESRVEGISSVCTNACWATYSETHQSGYIEESIKEYYNHERILREVGELFVLYLDPTRRNEGIGTKLLDAITQQQKEEFGAEKQWVSVQKGNRKGILFL
ncbi:GNAT superfamily N-acetyltransferase [Natronobacillus azotifigens]|uniref:GNAT family N-acetyltransferase n=1 Tax=Natronobacillus azotifigens TaxID=472978 RepID=UPI00300DE0C2